MTRTLLGAVIAVISLAGCNYQQSPLPCVVGQGAWFAKYTLKSGQTVTGPCTLKTGEGLGIRKYFPDGQKPLVTIRTDTLGGLATQTPSDPNPSHSPNSTGALSADTPDANNFCSVPTLSKAQQTVPPADISYEWSDVRFVTQANIPGTQLIASLKYTEGCTADYKVVAMTPNKDCPKTDAQGNPVTDAQGNPIPDDSKCRSDTSGVNPDFAVQCDPALIKCVLMTDPPSLRVSL